MSALPRIVLALASAACFTGCATAPSTAPSAVVASPHVRTIDADRVNDAVAIAKSTKAEVIAALGETLVIRFDTGFEVWVYRIADKAGPPTAPELVILFSPSGVVAKTRIRR
jgi:hypothetical protein